MTHFEKMIQEQVNIKIWNKAAEQISFQIRPQVKGQVVDQFLLQFKSQIWRHLNDTFSKNDTGTSH